MAGGGGRIRAPVITSGTSRMSWPVPWMTWLRGQWVGGGLGPGELQGEPTSGAVPALPHTPLSHGPFDTGPAAPPPAVRLARGLGPRGVGRVGLPLHGGTAGGAGWSPGRTLPPPLQGPPVPWPPPGPRRLLQDFWLSDPGSSGLRPLQVEPVAASGCLPQGPTVSLSRAPAGGSSGRRAAEGPPGLTRTWAWSTCLGGAASSR